MEMSLEYEEAVSDDRYKVIFSRLRWRIKVGEGEALYGSFISKAEAEGIAQLLRREFLNGAFVARRRDEELHKLGPLIRAGHRSNTPTPFA